jgi:hypothetical protein
MVPTSDSSTHLQEARIAVESAIAVAGVVAQNEIVECQSFNQMVVFLHDAAEAIARLRAGIEAATHNFSDAGSRKRLFGQC